MMFTFLPAFLLSGFVFAIGNMPRPIQVATHVVPARYFVSLLRGIYLKGVGLEVLAGELVILAVFGVAVVFAGVPEVPEEAAVGGRTGMGERLKWMMVKEFLQVLRDPRMLGVIFVIPLVQTLVFGYVVSTDVTDVPTAIVDFDRSPASRELVAAFTSSGHFRIVSEAREPSRAQAMLDDGSAGVVLRIDEGFAGDLAAGRTARMQLIVDGTDSNTARVVLVYAGRIAGRFSETVRVARVSRIAGRAVPAGGVELVPRAWFNENLESRNFFVPGIIAMLVMLVTVMLTSMAVVREKEVGTIEQLLVSPIAPAEFILGKTLPVRAHRLCRRPDGDGWWECFGSTFRSAGACRSSSLATTFYLMTTLGIGLLISTVCRTQQQAMMTVFFVFFPCILLSGFMFPIENMPPVVQYLTCLDPLRYFLVILRGIFLKGAGAEVLWPQMAALLAMGAATLTAATLRFRKTVAGSGPEGAFSAYVRYDIRAAALSISNPPETPPCAPWPRNAPSASRAPGRTRGWTRSPPPPPLPFRGRRKPVSQGSAPGPSSRRRRRRAPGGSRP